MSKKNWTIAGEPLTEKQIAAIKRTKADEKVRITIETDQRQSKAILQAASQAQIELQEIAALMGDRPKFAISMELRRKQLDMTLDQLAEITNISKANLSKLERGRTTNPTLETLRRIGVGLGLELTVDYQAAG